MAVRSRFLTRFSPRYHRRLQSRLSTPAWQEALTRGWVNSARHQRLTPPPTENVFNLPVEQLIALNGDRVRKLIARGECDEERLLAILSRWPTRWPEDVPVRLSFLGMNLGFACDMTPRCIYCNQRPVTERMTMPDWKWLLRSLKPYAGKGTYVYLTGGEPLLHGAALWGARGLICTATRVGAACNLNTNALQLTPRAALGLVSSGLGRIHISLDSHRPEVQDAIHQQQGRWQQVIEGLENLQIAKSLLGVTTPTIHLNCVLTNLNAWDFPDFLSFILARKPLVEGALSPDLDLHLIPVGGEQNCSMRLTAEEYEYFFTVTWDLANAVWEKYQTACGIPAEQRGKLHEKIPFLSPYHRVQQRGSLREWANRAGAGYPGDLALTAHCYVAATQAFVLPDGAQYWCGGHTVSRPQPVGNVLKGSVQENIQGSLRQTRGLPGPHCANCPGATQAINQTVETRLRQTVRDWLEPSTISTELLPTPDRLFE